MKLSYDHELNYEFIFPLSLFFQTVGPGQQYYLKSSFQINVYTKEEAVYKWRRKFPLFYL